MPGLSFVSDFKKGLHEKEPQILRSLDAMKHHENYAQTILLNEQPYFLACTGYKEYPLAQFENEKFLIYLEGKIYGKDHALISRELNFLAEWLFQSNFQRNEYIANWLLNTDGEFFVFILDKRSKSVCFLNDALGRLPVYYSKTPEELIVSREFRLFAKLNDPVKLDRMGVAQYLLFDYPLGKRTLLDNVHRLSPASVIKIDQAQVQIAQLYSFNFELRQHPLKPIEENTSELVKLFSEACINRAGVGNGISSNRRIVLGLSGGLDSRTVAVGLQNNSIPFVAVTRLDYLRQSSSDAEIAERLATALDIEWKLFRLEPTRGKDLLNLLRMKNGLNYLGIAFILPFFDKVRDNYGAGISYFTGDGGDKVLRELKPCWNLRSLDDLVNYILSRNQRFSLQKVSAVTKVPESEILKELKSHVSSFPENSWSQKYVHFLFSERGFKYLFEGEDRNRYFFWSTTPFYSIRFFRYAMKCPDEQKEKFALHRNLLLALSPVAASITYANWKVPISGSKYLVYLFIRSILDRIPPSFRKSIKNLMALTQHRAFDNHRACLHDQVNKCLPLNKYLDARLAGDLANTCNKGEIAILLTITSAIEEFECRQSTLSKYYDAEFA